MWNWLPTERQVGQRREANKAAQRRKERNGSLSPTERKCEHMRACTRIVEDPLEVTNPGSADQASHHGSNRKEHHEDGQNRTRGVTDV